MNVVADAVYPTENGRAACRRHTATSAFMHWLGRRDQTFQTFQTSSLACSAAVSWRLRLLRQLVEQLVERDRI
ncbi:MAG: hypothetical protein ABW069_12060, partial [Duganella sp.]